ncbi:CDP-glucose 4,6-dehydratase [Bosea sp. (in: a-proteobacteria)]|uniref:CDP-glucose 4,6-dehydratase n=1 Tax=Bosea sp. (in: a-proteobacteria) TaxID=1871050 RepID=UPI003B3BE91C
MAQMVNPTPEFWRGKRVLVTGHTGFKGAWLCMWLERLGALPFGLALPPETQPSLAKEIAVDRRFNCATADIRDLGAVRSVMERVQPDIVLHLAAQALVRRSYREPVETFAANLMGTVNVLEAATRCGGVAATLIVTTDKCYENREWVWPYRETDALGGYDPYSASKACAEIATSAWRQSQKSLAGAQGRATPMAIASARAGNVIGGGDWSQDRLIPDCIRAMSEGRPIVIRSPGSTRPWQHVLEPICGYLVLAERLLDKSGLSVEEAWNFGPPIDDVAPVSWIVERVTGLWGNGARWETTGEVQPHEAMLLAVDAAKARTRLGWAPRLPLAEALRWTVDWYKMYQDGRAADSLMVDQIHAFESIEMEFK